jgi:DNA-binding response OmpR family regulator
MDSRILIIDDNFTLVKTLTRVFVSQGYDVESCGDGESGWKYLITRDKKRRPVTDLILLDVNMPGIDGLTLLERIRADERFLHMPVIIITAQDDSDKRIAALDAGADAFLPKPFDLEKLLLRVESLVSTCNVSGKRV